MKSLLLLHVYCETLKMIHFLAVNQLVTIDSYHSQMTRTHRKHHLVFYKINVNIQGDMQEFNDCFIDFQKAASPVELQQHSKVQKGKQLVHSQTLSTCTTHNNPT